MSVENITLKFKDGNQEHVDFFASETDKNLITEFLQYAHDEKIVYYEALVDQDALSDLIGDLEGKTISDGVLNLSYLEFWTIHTLYNMHKRRIEEYDDFSFAAFSAVFNALEQGASAVFSSKRERG